MKILIYAGNMKTIGKSGVGMAARHQMKALELLKIPYTTNPQDDYDIAHINTTFPDSFLVAKKAKMKGKKVIYHAHSTEEDFRNSFKFSNTISPAVKQWLKLCYKEADLVLTPTSYSKKLLENYKIGKEIIPISNGIDLEFFKSTEEGANNFRKKYHFNEDDKVIMAVGLYIERKGILEFIDLAKRMPEYKFIWFGYMSKTLAPQKINDAIKNKPSNCYFPGYVSSEELKDAYMGSTIFLFPTKEETEGIVLLEALAMKIPVVISDIPIYDDWLTDGLNVYKAKNINEFETKIKGIINHTLPNITNSGYKVAAARDIKIIAYSLKKAYEKVLEKDLVEN